VSAPADVLAQLGELYATLSRSSGAMDDADDAERILAAFDEAMAGVKALAEREAARVAGLKARRIPDEVRAAELARVAAKVRSLSVGGENRSARELTPLVQKALRDIPPRRVRDYVAGVVKARNERRDERREVVKRGIEEAVKANRVRQAKANAEAKARYLAELAAKEAAESCATSTSGENACEATKEVPEARGDGARTTSTCGTNRVL
jgi:hypothetical protein